MGLCAVAGRAWPLAVAETGEAECKGRMTGRGITRPAQAGFLARKVGETLTDGEASPLHAARGSAP